MRTRKQIRKDLKARAKKTLKKHYRLFLLLCVISSILGGQSVMSGFGMNIQEADVSQASVTFTNTIINSFLNYTMEIAESNFADQKQQVRETEKRYVEDSLVNPGAALGRSRGVFASVVNKLSSGAYLLTLTVGIRSLAGTDSGAIVVMLLGALLLVFLIQIFVVGVYRTVMLRMFLEGRCYEKVPAQRVWFLLRVKKWCHVGIAHFVTGLLNSLWSLTIVGGIIKAYSYYLVPCILAENPDIRTMDAITLSRTLMYGHKWECFVFEASYWGWGILNLATLGVTGILYSNPYKIAALSEYYVGLRKKAIEEKTEGCEYLNDTYLYEFASDALIKTVYAEDMKDLEGVTEEENPLQGIPGFLADMFSISVMGLEKEREFEAYQIRQIRYKMIEETLEKKTYPNKLSPTPEERKRKKVEHMRYARCYSIWSLTTLFFAFSFVGWLWEVCLALVQEGMFVNRGVLHGPWLPIYGSGAVLILIVLNKFRNKPMIEFFSTIVLCGGVEYFTSWFLEVTKDGQRWWDYSGYFLNLNGRICAEGLLVFGLGGMVIVYVAAPLLDNMVDKVAVKILAPVCIAITVIFAADQIYSFKHPNVGHGITDYAGIRDIEMQGTDMRESIER